MLTTAAQLRAARAHLSALESTRADLADVIRLQTEDLLTHGAPVRKLETYLGEFRRVRDAIEAVATTIEFLERPGMFYPRQGTEYPAGVGDVLTALGVAPMAIA